MEENTAFVDRLIAALGLKSITVRDRGSASSFDTLGETGIRGRSVFSTSNRRLMRRALGMAPNPRTLSELGQKLERVCAECPGPEADAMLAAVRDASSEAPGRPLEELAARG